MLWFLFEDDVTPWRYGGYHSSFSEAEEYAKSRNARIVKMGKHSQPLNVDGTGFKEHFNHGLGMYISDRKQYRDELKKRKLVECGNERPDFSFKPTKKDYTGDDVCHYLSEQHNFKDSDIKELKDNGI